MLLVCFFLQGKRKAAATRLRVYVSSGRYIKRESLVEIEFIIV